PRDVRLGTLSSATTTTYAGSYSSHTRLGSRRSARTASCASGIRASTLRHAVSSLTRISRELLLSTPRRGSAPPAWTTERSSYGTRASCVRRGGPSRDIVALFAALRSRRTVAHWPRAATMPGSDSGTSVPARNSADHSAIRSLSRRSRLHLAERFSPPETT